MGPQVSWAHSELDLGWGPGEAFLYILMIGGNPCLRLIRGPQWNFKSGINTISEPVSSHS